MSFAAQSGSKHVIPPYPIPPCGTYNEVLILHPRKNTFTGALGISPCFLGNMFLSRTISLVK